MAGSENELTLRATWDRQIVGSHFSQDATPTEPNRQGHEGYRLLIPPTGEPVAAVTLFPEAALVRVQTRAADVLLRHATPPRLTPIGIAVETEDGSAQLLVTKSGSVAFQSFPLISERLQSPTENAEPRNAQNIVSTENASPEPSEREIRPSGDSSGEQSAAFRWAPNKLTRGNRLDRDGNPEPVTAEGDDFYVDGIANTRKLPTPLEVLEAYDQGTLTPDFHQQPRVSWVGYVSHSPRFRTDKSDAAFAVDFHVSEHRYNGAERYTVYHRVFTTNSKRSSEATRLQTAGLTTGEKVKVEGYLQPKTKEKDGVTRPDPRVYATHVRILRRNESKTQDSSPESAE